MRAAIELLAVALIAALALPAGPALADHHLERYALSVEGMSCSVACPPAIEGALGKIEGVSSVKVDFETKKATLLLEAGKELDLKSCNKALGNGGYFATRLEKLAPASKAAGESS